MKGRNLEGEVEVKGVGDGWVVAGAGVSCEGQREGSGTTCLVQRRSRRSNSHNSDGASEGKRPEGGEGRTPTGEAKTEDCEGGGGCWVVGGREVEVPL